MPGLRFFCEALLEIDVSESDAATVPELADQENWELLEFLRLPANSRCPLYLVAVDLVKPQFECPVDHADIATGDVCPQCGFDPAIDWSGRS